MTKTNPKVQTLIDAIPYFKKFYGKTIVIKYGGSAQTSDDLKEKFAQDIVLLTLLGIKPIVVHGGGARITELLTKLEIPSHFVDGYRVTCKESMRVVEMVLSGEINKNLASLLNHHGAKAIGISGKDSGIIKAVSKDGGKFGYTGDITSVNGELINNLIKDGFIPVIAPIANGDEPNHPGYNINADVAACEIAMAVKALPKGGYSKTATKTQFGYHVIYVKEIFPAKQLTFDEVKDNINQAMIAEKFNKKIDELTKELRKKKKIVIK